jgi:collagen type I/II/III/V/XI/XXIV/XXVII alpha
MANNRELSEFGSFVSVDNTNKTVGIATTVRITSGGLFVGAVQAIRSDGTWGGSTAGIQGVQGTGGVQGTTGAQGTTGVQGVQGRQGITGTQGATGTQGTQGATGSQGTTGAQGTTGTQGAGGLTTTDATTLNGISAVNLFNNMGGVHSTRTSFGTTPSYDFGFRFVQGSGNGPGDVGSNEGNQFYSWYIGLGSEYPATGSGSYGAMFAVDRNSSKPYLSVRFNESNGFGSWRGVNSGNGARVWVNFNGSNGSIRASHNTSSISRNSTGRYTVNFSTALADSNYALIAIGQYEYACGVGGETVGNYTTTSAQFWHGRYGSGTSADGVVMSVAIFR